MPTRVLVADDEEFERRAVARILSRSGLADIEVIEAGNGREAVEKARTAREGGGLSAAFLDIRMPGLDGIEAARLIREEDPGLPIVFLTAHDRFEYARSALRLRIDDFLLKPASSEEIVAALKRSLDSRTEREKEGAGSMSAASAASDAVVANANTGAGSAATWLADAIRAELAEGRVREEGLARWRAVSALTGDAVAAVALRIEGAQGLAEKATDEKTDSARRLPVIHPAAQALERAFARSGRPSIAGAAGGRALCLAFELPPNPGSAADQAGETEKLCDSIERAVVSALEGLRSSTGISAFAGCAFRGRPGQAGATDLARAAACAVALAGPSKAVVSVPVAKEQASGCADLAGSSQEVASQAAARALAIMEERLAEELSLDSVAAEVGVSPSHLSRLLARQAGMGFSDCLAAIRVERARSHLAGGAVSVKEVANLVGFHDPAYFARVFRRFTGLSPVEYRDRLEERPR